MLIDAIRIKIIAIENEPLKNRHNFVIVVGMIPGHIIFKVSKCLLSCDFFYCHLTWIFCNIFKHRFNTSNLRLHSFRILLVSIFEYYQANLMYSTYVWHWTLLMKTQLTGFFWYTGSRSHYWFTSGGRATHSRLWGSWGCCNLWQSNKPKNLW